MIYRRNIRLRSFSPAKIHHSVRRKLRSNFSRNLQLFSIFFLFHFTSTKERTDGRTVGLTLSSHARIYHLEFSRVANIQPVLFQTAFPRKRTYKFFFASDGKTFGNIYDYSYTIDESEFKNIPNYLHTSLTEVKSNYLKRSILYHNINI